MSHPEISILWFKRDLRVVHNAALSAAVEPGLPVLPLYVVEPDLWRQPDAAPRHYGFIVQCLEELTKALGEIGQPLAVRTGAMVDVLDTLAQQFEIRHLFSHQETGNNWTYKRDTAVARWCRDRSINWTQLWQNGVVRGLKDRNGWADQWGRRMHSPLPEPVTALAPFHGLDLGALPTRGQLGLEDDECKLPQFGGREKGLFHLDSFLYHRGEHYRTDMSSPLRAFDGCSRLSPYLTYGALSIQEVAQATSKRRLALKSVDQPTGTWRGSLSSFSGRLHWHCHFMQKLEDEPALEFDDLHPAYRDIRSLQPDTVRLMAWQNGETGLPFVDACMRCLRATGWMNFRMRAMLVAFASYHLWLDWRASGKHLARLFTDYEPGIHWPQVQMQSGTTGINAVRIYNPVKQGLDHDPDGHFVRHWVPELRDVPTAHIHEPWTWSEAGSLLDKFYPLPIVDHLTAAKEARQKIWAVRKRSDYRDMAQTIQTRHGSRRRGVRMRGFKPKSKKLSDQLSLNFE